VLDGARKVATLEELVALLLLLESILSIGFILYL
jgi:hypothetical protein